jgi:hypothetical protein
MSITRRVYALKFLRSVNCKKVVFVSSLPETFSIIRDLCVGWRSNELNNRPIFNEEFWFHMRMCETIFCVISVFFCISTRLQIGLEDANDALRDPLYWLYLTVLPLQGINCIVLLYAHKCNFTYGHKNSTAFPTPIFTKLTQCHYVQISCTDFHQYRRVTVRGMDSSSFTLYVRFSLRRFSRNS